MIGTLLLNRYELLEKIGEGGMGIVYKAKCHLLNRHVAIKILKVELSNDEDFVARFKKEASSAARLSHPNIVNVHDVGAENHINFIVMEYINGKTLKQVIKENNKLSPEKIIDITLQIIKALECAHKNKVIHRDIKPDNILITEDNIVKVADFGIAKVADSGTITNSNKIIGSAHYFSPEQARGNLVDCRTDIYSLGIVMYEMVTGRVPYNGDSSISVAMMHIEEPVIPPKEIIIDIPENINQVILKAVEKLPVKRYQTANEVAEILNSIKEDFDFKVKLNSESNNATVVMKPVVVSDVSNDSTRIVSQAVDPEKTMINTDRKVLFGNIKSNNNKKLIKVIGPIVLVMIIGLLVKYTSKGLSTETPTPLITTIVATTVPTNTPTIVSTSVPTTIPTTVSTKPLADEKKFVPSLIGSTQDIAVQIIVANEFLPGNISNDYSDNIAKGLVISQSPVVNTPYEKDGKIDIVISQGQKTAKYNVQKFKGNKKNKKDSRDSD